MSWETGLLGGFMDRKSTVEKEQAERARQTAEQEAGIFKLLLGSPDPKIAALAATGLLESARGGKKKGGLRGWLGEMESSPYLSQMQTLINTPVETDPGTMAEPPSTQYPALATPPPTLGQAPAGMPAQALTEPGAKPAPRPAPRQIPGVVGKPPTFGPRKILPDAGDIAAATAEGQYMGRGRAGQRLLREAQTPDERRLVMEQFGYSEPGRGATTGQFMGNVLGENIEPSEWTDPTLPDARQVYRRMRMPDGTIKHFPVDLTSAGAPTLREIAGPDGRPMTAQIYQDGTVVPLAKSASRTQFLQHVDAAGNVTYVPVNPYAAAPGAPRIGGQTVTPPPQAAPQGAGAAPAQGQAPAPAVGAPPPAATPAAGPQGISGGTRPVNFSSVPVAMLDAQGNLTTIQADRNPRTRELFDSVTQQPLTGQAFPITAAAQTQIRTQEQLKLQLADIQALADELLPGVDEVAAYKPLTGGWLYYKTSTDPAFYAKYQKLVSEVNSAAGAIRGIQKQSGAESKADYERALTALGNITSGDTKEAVAERIAGTNSALTAAQQSFINTLQRGAVGTAPPNTQAPDLTGLAQGRQRRFTSGPFAGQVWTLDAQGQPQKVQ